MTRYNARQQMCMGSAFHSHIKAYQTIIIYYRASVELMKSWKDFFSAAGMERNIRIICASSAEKKGTSRGSRKVLIEEICFVLFWGGGRKVRSNYKTTTWGSRAGRHAGTHFLLNDTDCFKRCEIRDGD